MPREPCSYGSHMHLPLWTGAATWAAPPTLPHTMRTLPEGQQWSSMENGPWLANGVRRSLTYSTQESPLKIEKANTKHLDLSEAKHSGMQLPRRRTLI